MRYIFGDCELNTETQEFRRGGDLLHAEPQVLAVLEYLVANRQRVVTKIELLDEVWGSRFVSESALTSRIKTARRLCGDTGRDQQIIRTVHGRGYRFIAELGGTAGDETTIGAPAQVTFDRRGGLVGRDADLATIDAAIRAGANGQRATVFVTGPAGIGKSALLAEAVERIDDSWHVLRGQALPSRGPIEPYFALLDALSRAGRAGDTAVVQALDRVAPSWLAQMPALVPVDTADRLERRLLGATPQRMLREGADVIEEIARTRRIVLVLEDLHWADACTIDVLDLLVKRTDPVPLVVLASARSDASSATDLAAAAASAGRARRLELSELGPDDVDGLVAEALDGAAAADDLLDIVRRRGAGIPLFVLEIVRTWRHLGYVVVDNGVVRPAVAADRLEAVVPDTLRQLVDQELAQIDAPTTELLEAAALVGREFDAASVAAALARPIAEVDAALTLAARQMHHIVAIGGSTWPDGTVSTRFEFTHDLFRQVLDDRLPQHQRAISHMNVGRALESGYAGGLHDVVGRLAEHFVAAGDHQRAVEYLREVGEQAVARSAHAHATDALLAALRQLERLPAGPDRDRSELRVRLALGPALVATRGWFGHEVAENYERALAICAEGGPCPEAALARYGLATITELRGEYERTERLLTPLVAGQNEIATEAKELMACSAFHQGKFELSLQLARGALDAWDGASSSRLMSRMAEHPASACNSWASLAAWGLGHVDDSLRFADDAIWFGRQHLYALSTAQTQRAFLHQLRREPEECGRWAREAIELAEAQGYPLRTIQAQMLLGWSEAVLGTPGGAARIAAALDRFRSTGARLSEPYFMAIEAEAELLEGRPHIAKELLDQALTSMTNGSRTFFAAPELHRLRALTAWALDGEVDRTVAADHLGAAIEAARALGSPVLEMRAIVDCLRLGIGPDAPEHLVERLRELEGVVESTDVPDAVAARAMLAEPG